MLALPPVLRHKSHWNFPIWPPHSKFRGPLQTVTWPGTYRAQVRSDTCVRRACESLQGGLRPSEDSRRSPGDAKSVNHRLPTRFLMRFLWRQEPCAARGESVFWRWSCLEFAPFALRSIVPLEIPWLGARFVPRFLANLPGFQQQLDTVLELFWRVTLLYWWCSYF